MKGTSIFVKGAKEHNLKNIDVEIPRDKFVVITGLSGSGKSSLAFDTIYAEGQRRYVESLSAYARQFLDQMEKPNVESIDGLSPAISIEQKSTSRNPRSTVATVTEIYDYLRLLFARIGKPHCPECAKPIESQTATEIIAQILALEKGTAISILAPLIRDRKGEYKKLFVELKTKGYSRAIVDGTQYRLEEIPALDKNFKHNIDVVVDRIKVDPEKRDRVADSVENALSLAEGMLKLDFPRDDDRDPVWMSEHLVCLDCQISFPELQPRNFSFNSPHGACTNCDGLGETREFDPRLVVQDPTQSVRGGAITPFGDREGGWYLTQIMGLADHYDFSPDTPFGDLSPEVKDVILYGTKKEHLFEYRKNGNRYQFKSRYEGVIPNMRRRYRDTTSVAVREQLQAFMSLDRCEACNGDRLQPWPLAVKLGAKSIADITRLSVIEAIEFFDSIGLKGNDALIAEKVLKEVLERLRFLDNVGLGYLTLSRSAGTLSGGEAQRIRLATQLGSKLMGVLYVLDEPSIGLHQRDNRRLIQTLKGMRDLGNTVLVVEHDEETIRDADYLVDLGPGAGEQGGQLVFSGLPKKILTHKTSLTGMYLSGRAKSTK